MHTNDSPIHPWAGKPAAPSRSLSPLARVEAGGRGSIFIELHQHPVGALRVDEGELLAIRAGDGRLVDQAHAFSLQLRQDGFNVTDLKADMVHTWAALLQAASYP